MSVAGGTSLARVRWIDAVRGGAVLLVVCFHAATLLRYADLPAPSLLTGINDLAGPFRMPTLVFLSGLFLGGSLQKGANQYFYGKLRMIGWPYLVWVSIFFVLSSPVHHPLTFLLGGTWLWFLAFLLIFYTAAFALQRVPSSWIIGASLVASLLAPDGSKWGERLLLLFAFFLAGHWMATHGEAWEALLQRRWVLGAALTALVLFATIGVAGGLEGVGSYDPMVSWASAAGIVVVLRAARAVASARWTAPLQWAGRHSLIFYATHFPVIYAAAHLVARSGLNGLLGPWGTYAVLLLTALVCAVVCATIVEREPDPAVRWLFSWAGGRGVRHVARREGRVGRSASPAR